MSPAATRTDAWGIQDRYKDALGRWRDTPAAARDAIRAAMGVDPAAPAPVMVVAAGRRRRVDAPAEVMLEDRALIRVDAALPADLPLGYHTLRPLDGRPPVRLIVTPARCHPPPRRRAWGWTVQLYASRSAGSWGIGDLADLHRLAHWAAGSGAGMLLCNPLGAVAPLTPQEASPYFPGSRRFRNPVYLRIDAVPGAATAGLDLNRLDRAGRALNAAPRIDRDAIFRLKTDALRLLWRSFRETPDFVRYCDAQGRPLAEFAVFCALAEHHGAGWHAWPAEYRRPDAPAVARFETDHRERVRFHQWLQWLLDRQLAETAAAIPLIQDLPIGIDPDGADAWAWQDVLAGAATVGAPPDEYNTRGQDWLLPPFVPQRLAAAGYEPFVQTIRACLRHAGGLRIDHIMGLFRLYWIPRGSPPSEGAYVRNPAADLLGILALESHRAGAFIVGEDLGTVEEEARARLTRSRVLSYRLVWFEPKRPPSYPRLALAAVTTHDLPTIAGLWDHSDLEEQRRLGRQPNVAGTLQIRRRLQAMTRLPPGAPAERVIEATHRLLARAPSALLAATLEDALAVRERPNMPGTTPSQRPNWSIPLPAPIDTLPGNRLAAAIAAALSGKRKRKGRAQPAVRKRKAKPR